MLRANYFLFLFFLSSIFLLNSCGSESKNDRSDLNQQEINDETLQGKITIAALEENFVLARQLANVYVAEHKNILIDVEKINQKQILPGIENNLYHLVLANGNTNPFPDMESYLLASDVFLLCVNFNNPVLQKLVIRGLKPSKIRMIFSSSQGLKWSNIFKTDDLSPIKPYLGSENSSAYNIVLNYLGIKESAATTASVSEGDLYSNIANNSGAIGFLSTILAYNHNTLYRNDGIYIIPVDFNENNVAEDSELIYDDLTILNNAYEKGSIPKGLIRNHYFVWKSSVDQSEIVNDFVNWVKENASSYLDKNGFFKPLNTLNE